MNKVIIVIVILMLLATTGCMVKRYTYGSIVTTEIVEKVEPGGKLVSVKLKGHKKPYLLASDTLKAGDPITITWLKKVRN